MQLGSDESLPLLLLAERIFHFVAQYYLFDDEATKAVSNENDVSAGTILTQIKSMSLLW